MLLLHLNFVLLYLDPGTGSMIIQFIIAAVAGVILYIGTAKEKIKLFFKRFKKK